MNSIDKKLEENEILDELSLFKKLNPEQKRAYSQVRNKIIEYGNNYLVSGMGTGIMFSAVLTAGIGKWKLAIAQGAIGLCIGVAGLASGNNVRDEIKKDVYNLLREKY